MAGCSIDELLQYGAEGKLKILVRVPSNLLVYSTSIIFLDWADPKPTKKRRPNFEYEFSTNPNPPHAMRDVQLLVLEPSDCNRVAFLGEADEALFGEGVSTKDGSDPMLVEPFANDADKDLQKIRRFRRFACYTMNTDMSCLDVKKPPIPTNIKLVIEALRVRRIDLESIGLLRTAEGGSGRFDNGFREESCMSSRLIFLNKGASHFWDRARLGWSEPTNFEVARWFRDEHKFPVKVAEGAAQILRQSYKDWDQYEYNKRRADSKNKVGEVLNMFDAVLMVSERWRNADLGLGDRADQIDTYPDKEKTLKLLISNYGFAKHAALAAWNIARPDNVKTIGRPRDFDD